MTFTLAGKAISRLVLTVPYDGVPTAEIDLAEGVALSGAAALVAGDLAYLGVTEGAVVGGVGRHGWTAGAGLWATAVPAKGYQSALGVLRSNVILDLGIAIAGASGGRTEPISLGVSEQRLGGIGSAYVRPAGPAWHLLRQLGVPWWVDGSGVTQVRERVGKAAPLDRVQFLSRDPEMSSWIVSPSDESFAAWLPGNTVDGKLIVHFKLEANSGEPTRIHLITTTDDPSTDPRTSLDLIIRQQTDVLRFHGHYEYRVITVDRNTVGLVPLSKAAGLPPLENRELRPGVPGVQAVLKVGQSVTVGFENGDPALPYVRAFEPRYVGTPAEVWLDAPLVKLGDAVKKVAREGDPVLGVTVVSAIDPLTLTGPLTFTSPSGGSIVLTFTSGVLVSAVGPVPLSGYRIGTPTQRKVYA
jgi:hypothetical protein